MNVIQKTFIAAIITGFVLVSMISCNNPAGPGIIAPEEESTGIDENSETGLIAGMSLEGDGILGNPDVVVSDGITWEEGLSGNAMRCDSDGDFLRIADGSLPELTLSGTAEVWLFPDPAEGEDNEWAGILHKGVATDFTDESWSLQYQQSEKIMFNYHYDNDGANDYESIIASRALSEGAWHHVAVSWSFDETTGETSLALYLDGELDAEASFAGIGPMIDTDGDLIVGSQLPIPYDQGYGHLTFLGIIDEISLYDRVRDAEEIEAAYELYAPLP